MNAQGSQDHSDRSWSQSNTRPQYSSQCIGCKCFTCTENAKTCKRIEEILLKKIYIKLTETKQDAAAVNLCEEAKEVMINYTYTDLGRQMMILDTGVLLSLAGVSWMTQYLEEFGLKVEDMKSVSCNQPFVFGPSRRYVSKLLVELPILVTRLDWKEDVLAVQQ